jgi:hypothetical protein
MLLTEAGAVGSPIVAKVQFDTTFADCEAEQPLASVIVTVYGIVDGLAPDITLINDVFAPLLHV